MVRSIFMHCLLHAAHSESKVVRGGFALSLLAMAAWLSRQWARPLAAVVDATARIAQGDSQVRLPLHRKDRRLSGREDPGRMPRVQTGRRAPPRKDMLHSKKGAAGRAVVAVTSRGRLPIHLRAVDPAAVMGVVGIVAIAVVVQHRQLVPHIDQRDAAKAGDQGVAHQNPLDRHVGIGRSGRLFQTCQRGKAAGNPFVARGLVHLKQHTLGKAARKAALVEIRQVSAVRRTRDLQRRRILVRC